MFINLNTFVRSEVTTIYLVKYAATVPIFGLNSCGKPCTWSTYNRLKTFMLRQPYLEVFKQKYPICNDSK